MKKCSLLLIITAIINSLSLLALAADGANEIIFSHESNSGGLQLQLVSTNQAPRKVHFSSGLGGYSPEQGANELTADEEIKIRLVMGLRLLCSRSTDDPKNLIEQLSNLLPKGQTVSIDADLFLLSDLECLQSLGFLRL